MIDSTSCVPLELVRAAPDATIALNRPHPACPAVDPVAWNDSPCAHSHGSRGINHRVTGGLPYRPGIPTRG
jgi:hypothetical protein